MTFLGILYLCNIKCTTLISWIKASDNTNANIEMFTTNRVHLIVNIVVNFCMQLFSWVCTKDNKEKVKQLLCFVIMKLCNILPRKETILTCGNTITHLQQQSIHFHPSLWCSCPLDWCDWGFQGSFCRGFWGSSLCKCGFHLSLRPCENLVFW